MSDVSKTNELIAEARQCHQARGWSKDPLVDKLENLSNRLANALEAVTRERDAATERYKDAAEGNRIRLVHAQDDVVRLEAELDAALAALERVRAALAEERAWHEHLVESGEAVPRNVIGIGKVDAALDGAR